LAGLYQTGNGAKREPEADEAQRGRIDHADGFFDGTETLLSAETAQSGRAAGFRDARHRYQTSHCTPGGGYSCAVIAAID